jgi:hypothetical protein
LIKKSSEIFVFLIYKTFSNGKSTHCSKIK